MSEAASRLSELKKKLLSKAPKPASVDDSAAAPPALPQPLPRPLVTAVEVEAEKPGKKEPLTLRSLMGKSRKNSNETSAQQSSGSRLKEAPAHRAAMLAESKSNIIRSKMISLNKTSVAEKIAHFEQNPPASLTGQSTPFSQPESEQSGSIFPIFKRPTLEPLITSPRAANPFASLYQPPKESNLFIASAPTPQETETNPFAAALPPAPVPETVAIAAQVPRKNEDVVKFIQTQRTWLKRRVRETDLQYSNTKKIKVSEINVASFIQEHKRFLDALVAIK